MYVYTHTMEQYSAIKKNKMLPTATMRIDLEGIMLSKISQGKTNTVLYVTTYMWNLKDETNKYYRMKTGSQIQRTNSWLPVGRGKWGEAREG